MKAAEYVTLFHKYVQDPPDVWENDPRTLEERKNAPLEQRQLDATLAICYQLQQEARELIDKRRAKGDSAFLACFREQHQKWKAIARRINEPEHFFKFYLTQRHPGFAILFKNL